MKSYKDITKSINEYRLQVSTQLVSQRALQQKFKEYPYGAKLLKALINQKVIIRHNSGYSFSNTPVYVARIESILAPIREYYKNYYTQNTKEQEYIKYLHSRGYQIFKIEYYD